MTSLDIVETVKAIFATFFFLLTTYYASLVLVGLRRFMYGDEEDVHSNHLNDYRPKISIIVPVKNEERVIDRLLKTLVNLTYPNKEIVVIEDESTDRTAEICKYYADKYPSLVKFFHRDHGDGKPSAINFAARKAAGEIIAIFDADTIIEPNILERIVPYFKDPKVAMVQGQLYTINPKQSLWTRLTALNDFLFHIFQLARDKLNLFVICQGTHTFLRRSVLEEVGFWDPHVLAEDAEISVRIMKRGYRIKYVTIRAGVEAPAKFMHMVRQRLRWFRGYLQALSKHKDILKTMKPKSFDAVVVLLTPVLITLSWPGFVFGFCIILVSSVGQAVGLTLLLLSILGPNAVALLRPKSLIYIPLLYLNWIAMTLISTYACLHALLRRPLEWLKTERYGVITDVDTSIITYKSSS